MQSIKMNILLQNKKDKNTIDAKQVVYNEMRPKSWTSNWRVSFL